MVFHIYFDFIIDFGLPYRYSNQLVFGLMVIKLILNEINFTQLIIIELILIQVENTFTCFNFIIIFLIITNYTMILKTIQTYKFDKIKINSYHHDISRFFKTIQVHTYQIRLCTSVINNNMFNCKLYYGKKITTPRCMDQQNTKNGVSKLKTDFVQLGIGYNVAKKHQLIP